MKSGDKIWKISAFISDKFLYSFCLLSYSSIQHHHGFSLLFHICFAIWLTRAHSPTHMPVHTHTLAVDFIFALISCSFSHQTNCEWISDVWGPACVCVSACTPHSAAILTQSKCKKCSSKTWVNGRICSNLFLFGQKICISYTLRAEKLPVPIELSRISHCWLLAPLFLLPVCACASNIVCLLPVDLQ